jgi:uncharacterized protein
LKTQLTQLAELPAPIRILAFLLVLGCLWLPLALPIALLVPDANQVTLWTMGLLFVEFVLLTRWWGNRVYSDRQIFQTYGLVPNRQNGRELLQGLGLGLLSLLVMFLLQAIPGWLVWQAPAPNFWRIALEGLLVAIGVGLAEELVFRGWILEELQRDYSPAVAAWATSLLFAVLHFIRPLPEVIRTFPQFPGLILLGLILVWMKQSTRQQYRTAVRLRQHSGRLGWPIGFHIGLVWGYYLLKVGELTQLTGRAPVWVTGIDNNPLAGVVGLLLLSGLAFYWRWRRLQRFSIS